MPKPENQKKKRRSVLEGFNKVPKLLEEARRAVEEVSQGVQRKGDGQATPAAARGRKGGGAAAKKHKVSPRKTSAGEGGPRKKPSRPPASRARAAAAIPPGDAVASPLPGLGYWGRVKHAIPGRIRLRLHRMLHNEALAAELPALLGAVPGITAVEASAATGSLLISFSPRELAAVKARHNLAGVMHRFFPGLDTESLINRMLGR